MKNLYLISIIFIFIFINILSTDTFGGNVRRLGEAGASELLINPWTRSAGLADANAACVVGLDALYQNVAGLSFTKKLDIGFTHTQYLVPSGIMLNNGGFAFRVGKEKLGVLAVGVMNMHWGEIAVTTNEQPDGTGATFSPSYTVITLGYAREFSNSIHGGIAVKVINENIATLSSTGVCFDAGIQYVSGLGRNKNGERNRDNLRFGISLKNVGTTMKYRGDGTAFYGISPETPEGSHQMTLSHRSQEFELPSLIKIAVAYDFKFWTKNSSTSRLNSESPVIDNGEDAEEAPQYVCYHKLTLAGTFTANSFTNDQFHLGLEYGFKNILFLRAGYMYEAGLISVQKTSDGKKYWTSESASTAMLGPTAGVSLQWPFNKEKGSVIAVDYTYRFTTGSTFRGIHMFGLRVEL